VGAGRLAEKLKRVGMHWAGRCVAALLHCCCVMPIEIGCECLRGRIEINIHVVLFFQLIF
jgi:hypothetical protein